MNLLRSPVRASVTASGLACGLAFAIACVPLAGCASDPRSGYSLSSSFDPAIATVGVPIFRNRTLTPGIEQQLTEALIKQIQSTTPMRVVQSEQAQSRLVGEITSVEQRAISVRSGTGLVQELAVRVVVDFTWTDAQTGAVLASRTNFSAAETFTPALPSGERVELGQDAVVSRLAQEIVGAMRSSW